jgi:RHS repeat-associated protein
MTTSNHASAGTRVCGNHANQRAQTSRCGSLRNGNTVIDDPVGLGGERLMEFQETCTGGACGGYTETQRWIYFAGRKMFSKTGSTLKAVTPNRLASEARHFPYGETDGTPPSDTKDYFATYRRDGTGLDYAWNRYYSPAMGRFTTADPLDASAALTDPQTWNRYAYVGNDPVANTDPTGLVACGDLVVTSGTFLGLTLRDVMQGTTGPFLLAQLLFNEAGTVYTSDLGNVQGISEEMRLIGSAVLNQYFVDNNLLPVYDQFGRRHYPLGSAGYRTFDQVLISIAFDAAGSLFNSAGVIRASARSKINSVLETSIDAPPHITDLSGRLVNQACEGLITAMQTADGLWSNRLSVARPEGLTLLFWNRDSSRSRTGFRGSYGYIGYQGSRAQGHTFWGLMSTPPPTPAPMTPRRSAPGRGPRVGRAEDVL